MNQPTLKTIIEEELEKINHKLSSWILLFRGTDEGLSLASKDIKALMASSISSAIKKAFEATAVEDVKIYIERGDEGWNAALAEKRQKETNFLTS